MNKEQLKAIIALPVMVAGVVPLLICVVSSDFRFCWGVSLPFQILFLGFAFILMGVGMVLFVMTNRLVTSVGQGTLAPWNPPKHLVIQGIYLHVRNPMISGVGCFVAGEIFLLGTIGMIYYFGFFIILNAIYIPFSEERGLERRFGEEYRIYKQNVPRWIPRVRPWKSSLNQEEREL